MSIFIRRRWSAPTPHEPTTGRLGEVAPPPTQASAIDAAARQIEDMQA
jgi:hypothetical protein